MPVVARSCNEIEHSSYSKLLHSGISIDQIALIGIDENGSMTNMIMCYLLG